MQFFKACAAHLASDPDEWALTLAADRREAAIQYARNLGQRDGYDPVVDVLVTPEMGGEARRYRVRSEQVWVHTADEIKEAAHA